MANQMLCSLEAPRAVATNVGEAVHVVRSVGGELECGGSAPLLQGFALDHLSLRGR
jgi:hypothetical protein